MQKERISFYMRPKTNWLRRCPFKAKKRVRTPPGVPNQTKGTVRFQVLGVRLQEDYLVRGQFDSEIAGVIICLVVIKNFRPI